MTKYPLAVLLKSHPARFTASSRAALHFPASPLLCQEKASPAIPSFLRISEGSTSVSNLLGGFLALHDLHKLIHTPRRRCIVLGKYNNLIVDPSSFFKSLIILVSVNSLPLKSNIKMINEILTRVFTSKAQKYIIHIAFVSG
ncbi:hypothetical protein LXL04_015026 [Taraxacum kok-saghyz]